MLSWRWRWDPNVDDDDDVWVQADLLFSTFHRAVNGLSRKCFQSFHRRRCDWQPGAQTCQSTGAVRRRTLDDVIQTGSNTSSSARTWHNTLKLNFTRSEHSINMQQSYRQADRSFQPELELKLREIISWNWLGHRPESFLHPWGLIPLTFIQHPFGLASSPYNPPNSSQGVSYTHYSGVNNPTFV